jgi:hypothetical protein
MSFKFYNQREYEHVPYEYQGNGRNIKTSGCGVCSACMIVENMLGLPLPVEEGAVMGMECGARISYGSDMIAMADEFSLRDFIPIYLAAGIGEEALFRAALLEPCGLIVSSLLFTALHIAYWKKPLMLVYVFATGLLFGVLYAFTESLLLCALVHAAFNTLLTLLLKHRVIVPRG